MERTELIKLRVSPTEKRGIEQRAQRLGYRSVSEFIREEMLGRALGPAPAELWDEADGEGQEFRDRVGELAARMPLEEARRRAFAEMREQAAA